MTTAKARAEAAAVMTTVASTVAAMAMVTSTVRRRWRVGQARWRWRVGAIQATACYPQA